MEIFCEIEYLSSALYLRIRRVLIHYWISFTAAFLLSAAAFWIAYAERGYRAFGSEFMVFPAVLYIGVKMTKPMRRRKRKGVQHEAVHRNQRTA